MLSSNAGFEFKSVDMSEGPVGILIIQKATSVPVTFQKIDYIRIGSYTKKLNEFPAIQSQLRDKLRNEKFEDRYAKIDLTLAEALSFLEYSA